MKGVELRYFGGMSEEETAEIMKTFLRTVSRLAIRPSVAHAPTGGLPARRLSSGRLLAACLEGVAESGARGGSAMGWPVPDSPFWCSRSTYVDDAAGNGRVCPPHRIEQVPVAESHARLAHEEVPAANGAPMIERLVRASRIAG